MPEPSITTTPNDDDASVRVDLDWYTGPIGTWQNLVTNPNARSTSGTVITRTNLATNPSYEGDVSSLTPTNSTVAQTTEAVLHGTKALKVTATSAATTYYRVRPFMSFDVTVGETYTLSVWAQAFGVAQPLLWQVDWYSGGSYSSAIYSPSVQVTTGSWTRLTYTVTVPAGMDRIYPFVRNSSGTAAGNGFYLDGAMAENAFSAGDYFDGDTAAHGEFTYAWTGTANNSTSVQRAPAVVGISSTALTRATAWQRQESGETMARWRCDVQNLALGLNYSDGPAPTELTTFALDVRPSRTLTGQLRTGTATLPESPPTELPAGQWTTLRATSGANPVAGGTGLFVYVGAQPGDTIDIRRRLMVPGDDYSGPYFDGDSDLADYVTSWLGTANASVSKAVGIYSTVGDAAILRIQSDGHILPVRNAEPAELDAENRWTGYDYEAPLDTEFYYLATSTDMPGQNIQSSPVTINSRGMTRLRHPGRPSANRAITLTRAPDVVRPIEQGVMNVLGRSRPVAIGMLRQSERGELSIYSETADERLGLVNLLSDGTALLLSVPAGFGLATTLYVSIGEVTEARIVGYGPEEARIWTLPFTVVDRPVGAAIAVGNAWSDVTATYTSWLTLQAEETSWNDVLEGVG